ncbi:uncharacterized protein PHACADRAFT_209461 [Phanerochaete carnosa HHB-10118-sp]|uniref:Uncharacterized protein n=1 Tax=Phanerochaete carnosa (strain HHB-10118-sp) TaxID=650164 RepID=K5W9S2_PHACS|nr:uncharacterized protein PHACADRAFT_209461 [Phanerochaete carnosa HHB-10118-sp]EKM55955.1 hypothetical protein PHACADRAFT_209461 [Phanerochaete carnosa HHB-10118-sp]
MTAPPPGLTGHIKVDVGDLKRRSCTTELDRIAGLAYLLGCGTLPTYNEQTSVESAWQLLLKHIPDSVRTFIFFHFALATPFTLWVSWARFMAGNLKMASEPFEHRKPNDVDMLRLLDESQLYSDNFHPRYYHEG